MWNIIRSSCRMVQTQKEPKKVVTLICDTGNKYLSKAYFRMA